MSLMLFSSNGWKVLIHSLRECVDVNNVLEDLGGTGDGRSGEPSLSSRRGMSLLVWLVRVWQ